jgi:allantoin racemase
MEIDFHKEIEKALGVPVIDPSIAALKRAEYVALLKRQCGWVPSRIGSCEPPSEGELAAFDAFRADGPSSAAASSFPPPEQG